MGAQVPAGLDQPGAQGRGSVDRGARPFRADAPRLAFRTIWISDTHLGTAGCNAELLLDFLKSTDCETLYLVGDIIDGWQLRKGWYWPPRHNDIVRCVLKKAKHGTRVVYVPGNHDEAFRGYAGLNLGGIELLPEAIHVTADGRKLLVLHGDEFDGVVLYASWLAFLGDSAYTLLLKLNARPQPHPPTDAACPTGRCPPTSRRSVKNAVQFISQLRGCGCPRRGRARRQRRRLRSHPYGRDPPDRRRDLLQRRRLGGELHRAGRACRRTDGDRRLGATQTRAGRTRRARIDEGQASPPREDRAGDGRLAAPGQWRGALARDHGRAACAGAVTRSR